MGGEGGGIMWSGMAAKVGGGRGKSGWRCKRLGRWRRGGRRRGRSRVDDKEKENLKTWTWEVDEKEERHEENNGGREVEKAEQDAEWDGEKN